MLRTLKLLLLLLVLIAFLGGSPWESLQTTEAQFNLAGDLDGDQRVDFKDLRILVQQWLDPWCVVSDCVSDLDGIDGVNMLDYAVLAGNWQQGQQVVINEIHYDPDVKTEL
ncbi:MAG TPA: hypothetical protein VMY06_06460, partial [Sedimentisphaerales bacterium]|nr:hypothetical protein [Sedimentisphaerales bacterium]